MKRRCLDCGQLTDRSRCPPCRRVEQARRRANYGPHHRAARRALATGLPARCGYGCGALLTPGSGWVAAHRVDGHPDYGWLASCASCNEKAKGRSI
jgi:hypothetical protein